MNEIKELGEVLEKLVSRLRATEDLDQRWVSIGATDLQTGLMALTRAVQSGNSPTDDERREDGPRQVALALVGGPDGNGHYQHRGRQGEHDTLKGDPKRHESRAPLVRLVTDILVYVCCGQLSDLGASPVGDEILRQGLSR